MSKVVIKGDASGTGTLTIAAPNTNSDVTFNLPTSGGTLATAETAGFPSGTVMLFVQSTAPTGWTKSTSHDNKALRVVSGTAGSGGSAAFTTAFGTPSVSGSLSGTVGATTLTTTQIPSHSHTLYIPRQTNGYDYTYVTPFAPFTTGNTFTTSSAGGGGSHTHSFSGSLSSATVVMDVAYVDAIIATKD